MRVWAFVAALPDESDFSECIRFQEIHAQLFEMFSIISLNLNPERRHPPVVQRVSRSFFLFISWFGIIITIL